MKFFSELKVGGLLVAIIVVLLPVLLAAQQSGSRGTSQGGPSGATGAKPGHSHQDPCWKQAGIPQNVIEQHKSIQQNIHSQVQAVCADSSLSDQQKRDKVRDIRKAGHEQMETLLTADQRSQLESCRASRSHHGGGHGGAHMGGGPCAEFGASKPAGAPPK